MTIVDNYCRKYLQSTGQMMSSVRLYFLPEYTLEGRQPHHGEVSTQIQIQIQIQMQKLKLIQIKYIQNVITNTATVKKQI